MSNFNGKNTECKSCGADIVFIASRKGNRIPCDAETSWVEYPPGVSETIVTPEGDVVDMQRQEKARVGLVSHFATCPNAASHRKKKEARAV